MMSASQTAEVLPAHIAFAQLKANVGMAPTRADADAGSTAAPSTSSLSADDLPAHSAAAAAEAAAKADHAEGTARHGAGAF